MPLTTTVVEGLERYGINLRYDLIFRKTWRRSNRLSSTRPIAQIPLPGQIAALNLVRAPMGVKSEGAVPNAWIYIDVKKCRHRHLCADGTADRE